MRPAVGARVCTASRSWALARPVRTQEPEQFALGDLEIDPADGFDAGNDFRRPVAPSSASRRGAGYPEVDPAVGNAEPEAPPVPCRGVHDAVPEERVRIRVDPEEAN